MPRLIEELFAIGYHQLYLAKQRDGLSEGASKARERLDRALGVTEIKRLGLTLQDIQALGWALDLALADRARRPVVGATDFLDAQACVAQANDLLVLAADASEEACSRAEAA